MRAVPVLLAAIIAMTIGLVTTAGASERAPEAHKPFKYKKRYKQCRDALGAKPAPHKGTFQDARRCRVTWKARARTNHVLALRWVWPKSQWSRAERVTKCEGNHRINAVGDNGYSFTSWQINIPHWPNFDVRRGLTNAIYAAKYALMIHERQGWSGWTCARILGIR